jgi:hypothetical protein
MRKKRWPDAAADYKHWGNIGAALFTSGAVLAMTWYGLMLLLPQRHLPWWPLIPLGAMVAFGLYLLMAGWAGLPVPSEKRERMLREFAKEQELKNQEAERKDTEWRAAEALRKEEAARSWQCGIGQAYTTDAQSRSLTVVALNCPEKSRSAQFIGKTAQCEITQSANVYKASAQIVDANRGFRLTFPDDFSPLPTILVDREYLVAWASDVLEERVKASFRLDRFSQAIKLQ